MKEKLGRWGLVAVVVLLAFMVFVNLNQARTIAQQKTELVAQIKTLIASEQQEVKMIHDLDDMDKKFQEALKTCKK